MSAKPRTAPRDLVLPVPLAQRPGAKARGLPPNVPAVRIPLGFSAISMTCWRREGNWVQTFSAYKSILYAGSSSGRGLGRVDGAARAGPSLSSLLARLC